MKKRLVGLISLVGLSLTSPVFALDTTNVTSIENKGNNQKIAYTENDILQAIKQSDGETNIILPYKQGTVILPPNYKSEVVKNPTTSKSYIKIKSEISTRGVKKTIIVNTFRYGGKALSKVTGILNDDAAKYISKNSGKIANAIDRTTGMIHGEILQSLLNAGVPLKYARDIAWAIDVIFL